MWVSAVSLEKQSRRATSLLLKVGENQRRQSEWLERRNTRSFKKTTLPN